ncbi:MAG: class I SAM-dependent RNA methyltransferase, partial [Deltaproteobacteria bacterium]
MGRRRRRQAPVDVTLDRLEARGVSGLTDDGRRVEVRYGAVGARVSVRVGRKGKGQRLALLQPAPDQVPPACPVFGLCGGCQLQEMPLHRQRVEKAALVARLVGHPCTSCEGAEAAYGYRNKLELSFGARRFLAEATDDPGEIAGSWLGFHPPGWYSRIVDVDGCPLGSPAMNRVIAAVRDQRPAPAWDNATHAGWWRHLVLREGDAGVLVTLVTHGSCPEVEVRRVADAVAALDCVTGVSWRVNDGVAEVATGQLRAVLHGAPGLSITLGDVALELPPDAFFQVNTPGAAILVDRVGEALRLPGDPAQGSAGGTLLDL